MERQDHIPELSGHVILFNANEKVAMIVQELHNGTLPEPVDVVLVCKNRASWEANPKWHPRGAHLDHFHVTEGNPTNREDLTRVGIAKARAAVILADPEQGRLADARSTLVAVAIERQNPQVHTVMELIASQNRVHLKNTEVNEVVCLGELSEKLIAQSCITPGVKNIFDHLLSSREDTNQIFVRPVPQRLRGSSYREIVRESIRSGAPYILCGFGKLGPPCAGPGNRIRHTRIFAINPGAGAGPGKDTPLHEEDRLVVIAREPPEIMDGIPPVPVPDGDAAPGDRPAP